MATKLNTDELLDVFKNMSVLELNEFLKAFEEEFGVTAAAVPSRSRAAASAGGPPPRRQDSSSSRRAGRKIRCREVGSLRA